MKRKNKKKLILNLTGALTAIAIPAITVVSCSDDKPKVNPKKTIQTASKTNKDIKNGNNKMQSPKPQKKVQLQLDEQAIKNELSKISNNITFSTSNIINLNSLKSKDLGITETNGFRYSYAHQKITSNGEIDISVSISKIGSLAKIAPKIIKLDIIGFHKTKLNSPKTVIKNVIPEISSSLSDLNFDNSLPWVKLKGNTIQDTARSWRGASEIIIDADEAITNNFTFDKLKKLFSLKTKENLKFSLEDHSHKYDSKGILLDTKPIKTNDFKVLSNQNKELQFKLVIYAADQTGMHKKYLRNIKIFFQDTTSPILSLKKNRPDISILGKINDVGPYDPASKYKKGELFIPVGWDNQGKDLLTWIREQFIITDVNQGAGASKPIIKVDWIAKGEEIKDFSISKKESLLTIRGFDNNRSSGNRSDYKMYLYVSVIKADYPVSIIENIRDRDGRKYSLINENGISFIRILKSDITNKGWKWVYDEVKKIYKVFDRNSFYNGFIESKYAEIQFPDIQSPLISKKNELNILIKIKGVLTNLPGSKNEKTIKLKIIDDTIKS